MKDLKQVKAEVVSKDTQKSTKVGSQMMKVLTERNLLRQVTGSGCCTTVVAKR